MYSCKKKCDLLPFFKYNFEFHEIEIFWISVNMKIRLLNILFHSIIVARPCLKKSEISNLIRNGKWKWSRIPGEFFLSI